MDSNWNHEDQKPHNKTFLHFTVAFNLQAIYSCCIYNKFLLQITQFRFMNKVYTDIQNKKLQKCDDDFANV